MMCDKSMMPPEDRRPRTVSVYAIHTDTVRLMDWTKLRERMPERTAKANRYCFERDRLLCVGGGLLMMEVLGIHDESELRYGPCGKAYAPGYPGFNLSHSGQWCVLAVGEGEIGVDIERIDGANLDVAPRVFTAAEMNWMNNESPEDRFHTLWTLKESVAKAIGRGMSLEPGSFEVLPLCDGESIALCGSQWYAACGELDDCRYSVCAPYPPAVEWHRIERPFQQGRA